MILNSLNMTRGLIKSIKLLTIVGYLSVLSSCLNDESKYNAPAAYVSFYQGSPDAPDFAIKVNDRTINTDPFKYSDNTGYLRLLPGERNLKFETFDGLNVQIDSTVEFEVSRIYSIYISGEYINSGILILDDNSATPASGKAKLRVINLSPDAPEIDLSIATQTDALVEELAFEEASEFEEITAQRYDFQVKSGDDILLAVPNINLQPGYHYTLVIRGYVTPTGESTRVLAAQLIVNQL